MADQDPDVLTEALDRLLKASPDQSVFRSDLDLVATELALPARDYSALIDVLRTKGMEVVDDQEADDEGWNADGFDQFVRRTRHDLLSFEEEQALGRRIDQGRLAEAQLAEQTDPERRRWLRRVVADGKTAKDELAAHNIRLVMDLAHKIAWRGSAALELEDLVQEGYLGLAHAIEKWEYQRGLKFSTYATWWIRQHLQRSIQDKADAIRMPVYAHEVLGKIRRAERELVADGRRATVSAIAERARLPKAKVRDLLGVQTRPTSLDRRLGPGPASIGDLVADSLSESPEAVAERRALRTSLFEVLSGLTQHEQRVMRLRFGLDDGHSRTLDQIGREFGVTRERIRQIEAKTLAKLRHPLRSQKLYDYYLEN